MTSSPLSRRINTARIHAQLSIPELWARYLGVGGGDLLDVDGNLHGLPTLDGFQQDILAQAVNEALMDLYDAYAIPLSMSATGECGPIDQRD